MNHRPGGGQGTVSDFLQELKRRNVFRVAVAYLVSGWLVLQVAELVVDITGAPDWALKFLLLLGLLGFPIVLIFSWAYELTPEGVKREKDVDRSESITRDTGRKLNIATIVMLIAVLAVVSLAVVGCRALQGYEKAYKPTSGGDIEIKTLPEARVLAWGQAMRPPADWPRLELTAADLTGATGAGVPPGWSDNPEITVDVVEEDAGDG